MGYPVAMRSFFFACLVFLSSLCIGPKVFAQHDSTAARPTLVRRVAARFDSLTNRDRGLVPIPLLYYTPDTRLAYGLALAYYFKIKSRQDTTSTRLSYIQGLADYTQNRQLDVWSYWYVFLRDEKWILKGELRYRNFPDRFYGIGNDTPDEAVERFSYNLVSIKELVMRKVALNVYVGGDFNLAYLYRFRLAPEGQLAEEVITGSRGGVNSGLGAVFLIDTRDNVANATKGRFLEVSSYFYGRYVGGDFQYTNLLGTYNQYWRLPWGRDHILASNTFINLNFGNPPFVYLSPVGNEDILRGYPRNRYRDLRFMGTQLEYRMPLFWRIGVVGFAGVGEVFDRFSDVRLDNLKYSFGGGLRLMLNRKERVNIRLDYGIGRGSTGFYLGVMEAF
jgi:outer membrane protein assembly factor BamA